jgi:hypothetical protein
MKTSLKEKIDSVLRDKAKVRADFEVESSGSTQAELRLVAEWTIRYPVDSIRAPKRLDGEAPWAGSPWQQYAEINGEISEVANLASSRKERALPISARTKSGPAKRDEAKELFENECAKEFLADYRRATGKKRLAEVRAAVGALQKRQEEILKDMRAENSRYLSERKAAKAAEREADAIALKAGRFWEASREALKGYFNPPFEKNHLADVSERWRAALYLECESAGWKDAYGNWRHKLVGTGRAYLCGIDDNGDEWGHELRLDLGVDEHGNVGLDADVEDAMAELFQVPSSRLRDCERQGDLLFLRCAIPATERAICPYCGNTRLRPDRDTHETISAAEIESGEEVWCGYCGVVRARKIAPPELAPHEGPWEVRESHRIEAEGLERNGRWFRSPNPIKVSHTSHRTLTLEPGEYRLYELQVEDAD